jgi:hypothetical protein
MIKLARKWSGLLLLTLMLSACNLSSDVPGGLNTPRGDLETEELTTLVPITEEAQAGEVTPTGLPGITLSPNTSANRAPTRTPFGLLSTSAAPTPNAVTTALPTAPTGETAVISSPAQGASVAPGTIQISGFVYNLPEDRFTLTIVQPDDSPLNSQNITLRNPNQVSEVPWSAAVQITRYTGPAQIRIIARTREGGEMPLAAVDIVIGQEGASGSPAATSAPARPANSPTGSIDSPRSGEIVAGDPIMVTGTAGGFPGGTFNLELLASDGNVLASIPITLSGSDTAAVPWSAPINTGSYRGTATIRAVVTVNGSPVTLASANVTLG